MVDKARRKDLLRAYAERKPQTGVFAVRCAVADAAWVAWSTSLDKRQNSLWFQLRAGGCPHADMQALWKTHGEDAFSYDILEQIEEDDAFALERKLDERAKHWREQLKAKSIPSR